METPTMSKPTKKTEQREALERLRQWIKPGDTLYTILRHRSASGMNRVIQVIKIENGEPVWLGYNVAKALGRRYDERHEGVVCQGGGMDMGFDLVYSLSCALFCADKYTHDAAYSLNHR